VVIDDALAGRKRLSQLEMGAQQRQSLAGAGEDLRIADQAVLPLGDCYVLGMIPYHLSLVLGIEGHSLELSKALYHVLLIFADRIRQGEATPPRSSERRPELELAPVRRSITNASIGCGERRDSAFPPGGVSGYVAPCRLRNGQEKTIHGQTLRIFCVSDEFASVRTSLLVSRFASMWERAMSQMAE